MRTMLLQYIPALEDTFVMNLWGLRVSLAITLEVVDLLVAVWVHPLRG